MAKVVSNIPTIWEDEVYSVLCLIKKIIKNINTNVIPQINENSENIESLQGNIITINNALSTINTTLKNHDKRITSNTSQINTINGAIETIQDQIVTINDKLAYFSDRINSNTTQIGNIQQTVNQHTTAIAGLGESISDLEDNVSTLETTVSRHTTEIGNINTALPQLSDRVTSVENSVSNINSKLTGYDQRITSNTNKISQLNTSITTINGNISDMQQQINSADNTIEQHTSQIGKLEDSVESVEGELEGYNNKFNNLEYLTEVVMDTNNLFTIPDAGINYLVNWGGFPPGDIIIRLPAVGPGSGSYKVQHIYFQWPAGTKTSFKLSLQNSLGNLKPFTVGNDTEGLAGTGVMSISYPAGMNYEATYLGHLEIVYRGSPSTNNALVRLV